MLLFPRGDGGGLGCGSGGLSLFSTQPLALLLSLLVAEESIMSMTCEGAPFPLPEKQWQGPDNFRKLANRIDYHLQTG